MARVASKNTLPEIRLRKFLHGRGLRYRLHVKSLVGNPDIVLAKHNAVIQVRGCFWHQHTCSKGRIPSSNRDYWVPKLTRTKQRDNENDRKLIEQGWRLWIVWECQMQGRELLEIVGEQLIGEITNTAKLH